MAILVVTTILLAQGSIYLLRGGDDAMALIVAVVLVALLRIEVALLLTDHRISKQGKKSIK